MLRWVGTAALGATVPGGGMPFMPMCPPMGGGGGNNKEDRERTTWLLEDRPIWSTDLEVGPGVVRSGVKRGEDDGSLTTELDMVQVPASAGGSSQRPHVTKGTRT